MIFFIQDKSKVKTKNIIIYGKVINENLYLGIETDLNLDRYWIIDYELNIVENIFSIKYNSLLSKDQKYFNDLLNKLKSLDKDEILHFKFQKFDFNIIKLNTIQISSNLNLDRIWKNYNNLSIDLFEEYYEKDGVLNYLLDKINKYSMESLDKFELEYLENY